VTEPLRLCAGAASAWIFPADGGRLGQLDFGGGALLRGPADGMSWLHWGAYPLLPWSNRIPGGHVKVGGLDAFVPVNNHDDGTAMHGLAANCAWTVGEVTDTTADLWVHASAGPYAVRGSQRFALRADALELTLTVRNVADHAVPAGLGIHPWFRGGSITLPAAMKWPGDPMPLGSPVPVGPDDDFREGAVPPVMDRCFTDLSATSVDVPGLRLAWDGPVTQVVVYSGEPGWVCVEPVTMANDGFNLAARGVAGHGVQWLDPDAEMSVRYTFSPR
jgi:aldose 1-epimerase